MAFERKFKPELTAEENTSFPAFDGGKKLLQMFEEGGWLSDGIIEALFV